MQSYASSFYNSKPIWIIGSTINPPSSNIFRLQPCEFGGILDTQPAAIVIDPDHRGLDFSVDQIRFYQERFENIPIVVYSSWKDETLVFPLMKAGISGYLLKDSKQSLDDTLIAALSGGVPLSSRISALLIETTRSFLPDDSTNFNLTTKEIELLQLMSEGKTKKQISESYNRSIHTIDNHVRKIYLKMAVNNLGEAIGNAFRAGLIY